MAENAGKYMEVRRTISGSHGYPWSTNNVTVTTKYGEDIQTKVNTWEGIPFFNSFNK